ncbi:sucrose transporter [Seiridium cupressi]
MASDEEELVLRSIENDCDDAEHATRHTKMRLLIMTCAIGGLQLIWSIIFAYGTEYLLLLGLSKSMTSIAWIIGPFCGMVIQPFFGVVGANGILVKLLLFVGATASCFCLAGLATVEDVVMSGVNGANDYAANGGRQGLCSSLALFWILALNLSIQPFQAASRALVVESCHESEQSRGSAWIGRAVAVGNIFGYMLSVTPFAELLLLRRFTPFQSLCAVVSSLVMVLVSIPCYFAPNSGYVDKERAYRELLISTVISRIGREVRSCSSAARKVITVQFFSWMAWFPIIYYHTK